MLDYKKQTDVTRFLWLKDPTVTNIENIFPHLLFLSCTIWHNIKSISTNCHNLTSPATGSLPKSLNGTYIWTEWLLESIHSKKPKLYTVRLKDLVLSPWILGSGHWTHSNFWNSYCNLIKQPIQSRRFLVLNGKWYIVHTRYSSSADKIGWKREVLQIIACIFYPLGYFAPSVLKAKLFMKKLWKSWIGMTN